VILFSLLAPLSIRMIFTYVDAIDPKIDPKDMMSAFHEDGFANLYEARAFESRHNEQGEPLSAMGSNYVQLSSTPSSRC